MVDCQIHTAGIIETLILEAFSDMPREMFVPEALQGVCYADEAIATGGGRFLLEPIVHSRIVQALAPRKNERVLDIGGGTGYPAAIMARLAREVVVLEDRAEFLEYAAQVWGYLGLGNIVPVKGRLTAGHEQAAPFDVIILNGAVAEVPQILLGQLAEGGRLAAVVKQDGRQVGQVIIYTRSAGNNISQRILFEAGMDYLPGFEPKPAFEFN